MRAKLTAGLDAVRAPLADLHARSRRTFVLLVTCLLIVALGPLVLTLARADDYEASFSIAQAAPLPLSQASQDEQVAGVQLLVGAIIPKRDLARDVLERVDFPDRPKQVYEQTRLRGRWRDGRPEVVVAALAPTSDQARALAEAVSEGLSERVEPVARLGPALEPVLRQKGRAYDPPTAVQTDETRLGDTLIGVVPGEPPPRPQPGWAALAGVALAAALLLCVLMAGRGRQPLGGT